MRRKIKRKFLKYYESNYYGLKNHIFFSVFDYFYEKLKKSDLEFTKGFYKSAFQKELNIDTPLTYNEKINWLKLNNRALILCNLTDKIKVREYVAKTVGEKYLIPLLNVFDTINEFKIDGFPNYPFIVKTNHDSGSYFIVKDKSDIDLQDLKLELDRSLCKNFYFRFREWQYKNIEPKILVEKLLLDFKGKVPNDYKFHCSNGRLLFIQVDSDRELGHYRNNYDENWNLLPFEKGIQSGPIQNKPNALNEMIFVAKRLSENFAFTRVDLYECNDQVFFGEITFTPGAGTSKFYPEEYDQIYGAQIELFVN